MKTLSRISILSLLAGVLLTGSASAQSKIGFVDVEKIVQSLPEFKGIDTKLRTLRQTYEDTLRLIQSNFQARAETYQKQQALMSPDARQKEEADLNTMREQYLQFQQERLGAQGTLAQVQEELLAPIRDKVRAAIEKVAKEEKYSGVMDKAMCVYLDTKYEITFKVLDYINRGSN